MNGKTRTIEENRKYMRDRRAKARREGKCGTCCRASPDPGLKYCGACLARIRAAPSKGGPGGPGTPPPDRFCVACQAHGFHRDSCPTLEKRKPKKRERPVEASA